MVIFFLQLFGGRYSCRQSFKRRQIRALFKVSDRFFEFFVCRVDRRLRRGLAQSLRFFERKFKCGISRFKVCVLILCKSFCLLNEFIEFRHISVGFVSRRIYGHSEGNFIIKSRNSRDIDDALSAAEIGDIIKVISPDPVHADDAETHFCADLVAGKFIVYVDKRPGDEYLHRVTVFISDGFYLVFERLLRL